MKKKLCCIGLSGLLFSGGSIAQTVVYSDNFSASQGSTYTTNGFIGASSWEVTRSGEDWGARIDGGLMTLNNDVSLSPNVAGWVYSSQSLISSGFFNTTFSNSEGLMTWSFNMQQIRPAPAGFSSGNYGVAYIIGSSSALVSTQGSGYAVVLGNTSSPDPLRLVSFTGGISSIGNSNSGLIVAGSPLNNPTNSYMSVRLTYNPIDNAWEMFGRDDGTGSFADPNTGTLTSLGTAVDSTYTGIDLTSSGAYWQGSTAATQTARFDNVRLEVVPEPTTWLLVCVSLVALAIFHYRQFIRGH